MVKSSVYSSALVNASGDDVSSSTCYSQETHMRVISDLKMKCFGKYN